MSTAPDRAWLVFKADPLIPDGPAWPKAPKPAAALRMEPDMANEKVEAVIRRTIEARASAIVDNYVEMIRDELRNAIGDIVATVATERTIEGAELVVRVKVGKG